MPLVEKNKDIEKKKKYRVPKKEARTKEDNRIGCPLCGRKDGLRPSGRCVECIFCGYSKCSL